MVNHLQAKGTPLRPQLMPEIRDLRDYLALLGIFILLYFFKLSSFSISIDDEMAAGRESADVWLLQGRWAIYFLERFFISQQVIPFFPFFVFGCCLAISYRRLLAAFDIDRLEIAHFLAFVLYAGFPVWMYAVSFFSNTIAFGLGQLAAVMSFVAARPVVDSMRYRARSVASAACLLALSIAFYQSFLFEFFVLGGAWIITRLLEDDTSWTTLVRRSLTLVGVALAAVVIYKMVDLTLLLLTHSQENYVGNYLNLGELWHHPWTVLTTVLADIARTYAGSAKTFGAPLYGFALVVLCASVAVVFRARNSAMVLKSLLAMFLLGCLPFTLHTLAAGNLPARTLVAVPSVMWFMALVGLASDRRWLARSALVAVLISTLQIVYVLNLMQTANIFARKHDEALASAVYARVMDVVPAEAASQPVLVDFYGAQKFDGVYHRSEQSPQGYSFFEWDGGSIYRITAYMRLLGYSNLSVADPARRHANDVEFQKMPIWPAQGAVRWANGMVMVRLGEAPGFR